MMKHEGRKGSVMYKSQLQEYAQKAAIPPPIYEFVKEGASHEPRFKAIVILNNVTYESPPGFPNLKSAEHAAAKAALDGLLQSTGGTGVTPSPVHESGLCKNLLQEYAQKNSLPLPVYQSQRSGEDHAPTFTSSVEIAGVRYSGGSAKNKKEAEIKAARTALLAIQSSQSSFTVPDPTVVPSPQPHVGLATLITSHLNNTPGKKRGRGAQAATDEPTSGRLKIDPTAHLATPEAPVKVAMLTSPVETSLSLATLSKPEVQKSPITSPSMKSSLDIASLFATPGAKKILGVTPQLLQTEVPYLMQGPALLPSSQTTQSSTTISAVPQAITVKSNVDAQGKSTGTQNGVVEGVTMPKPASAEDLHSKEGQSCIQASQSTPHSAALISLTGEVSM